MRPSLGFCLIESPIGWIGIAGGPAGLIRITLPRTDRAAAEAEVTAGLAPIAEAPDGFVVERAEFARYFRGEPAAFAFQYDDRAVGEFTRRVYAVCRAIPPGEVVTYAELARRTGRPGAARAVGRAMATNPWPIAVPCHRVVGSDGTLRGYGGGLPMKAALQAFERGGSLAGGSIAMF